MNQKQLPPEFPPLLRNLYEHGYEAQSGNTARLMVVEQPGVKHKTALTVMWKRPPSAEDKTAFETAFDQIISAASRVRQGPCSSDPKQLADAMVRFLTEK
jgi:hypothetical protein